VESSLELSIDGKVAKLEQFPVGGSSYLYRRAQGVIHIDDAQKFISVPSRPFVNPL
jgi:hypothetical protein